MMKKLRVLLTASLLVTALVSNANAFTTDDSDGASSPSRPRSDWCSAYWNGQWWTWPC